MIDRNGTPIWFELTTASQDRAHGFYEAVAGWAIAPSPMDDHGEYRIAVAGEGRGVAGLMPAEGGMPPGWTIYFAAVDVDAMADKVRRLGGQVHVPPSDIPSVGRFAAVADPQGIGFNIMTSTSNEGWSAFHQAPDGSGIGRGVWIELATPDPEGAFAFYGALFGWTKASAMPMGDMGDYAFIGTEDEGRPGAIMSSTATNTPARWSWYIEVADIDAALETAKMQGGSVLQGPDQIPGGNYSANLADAEGHRIGLVGPRT